MHYVTAQDLTKSYGIKPLFDNLTFHISEGDKIALVARNGSGKSTLLKIVAGLDTPDEGNVWIHKDVDVAFFEQEPRLTPRATILDNIFNHEHPVIDLIKKYEAAVDTNDTDRLGELLGQMDEARRLGLRGQGEADPR
jgi:ATP-binding cassette subfamily F protein uup